MVYVIASIRVKAGRLAEFLEIFKSNVPAVTKEKGCIEYFPAVDLDADLSRQDLDANTVTVLERWDSLEALHAHLKAPHMVSYREKVKEIVEGSTLKVLKKA